MEYTLHIRGHGDQRQGVRRRKAIQADSSQGRTGSGRRKEEQAREQ